MKAGTVTFLAVVGVGVAVATAGVLISAPTAPAQAGRQGTVVEPSEKPFVEGPIHSVAYEQEGGKLGGFTRVNDPGAVPGGNGSWNDRRYGKLYREYLIVTKPDQQGWGVLVIPSGRLRSVHFAED
jgi:hypothetical protein